jgi:hypothetical protein
MGVLFTPFRTGAAHVVLFGPIGIEDPLLQSARNLDRRRRQIGRREDDLSNPFGWSENRDCGAAHDDYSICSFASFKRNEPSEQLFELAWQRLRQGRTIAGLQLATDCA